VLLSISLSFLVSCKYFSHFSLPLFFSLSGINVADNGEPREVSVSAAGAFLFLYLSAIVVVLFF
jgi:hypothetical protein